MAEVRLDEVEHQIPDQRQNVSMAGEAAIEPRQILERFSDQQMIDALKQLPEEFRWAVLLVDVEGMDHADAADLVGVPIGTIKSRAHRGRAMLRTLLLQPEPAPRLVNDGEGA